MNVQPEKVRIKGLAIVRDKNGNPKIDSEAVKTFWPHLSEKDKAYIRNQYEEYRSWR